VKTAIQAIEDLFDIPIYSTGPASQFEPLSEQNLILFYKSLLSIANSMSMLSSRRVTLTFRGDSDINLSYKLSSNRDLLSEDLLFDLYFFFGEKAKHFYEVKDDEIVNSKWMKEIEDYSEHTLDFIFDKIQRELKSKSKEIKEFKLAHPEFCDYFGGDNKERFISTLSEIPKYGRDYYLYFLHTAGWIGISQISFLVSTSLSYDAATNFGTDGNKQYVTYYIIPEPFDDFAVSHLRAKKYEPFLKEKGLPLYSGNTIHPSEREVAVKAALFPHFILGVRDVTENRFIANPHLFSRANQARSIIQGLDIDQSGFAAKLNLTSYKRGAETFLDGWYKTIRRA